MGWDPPLMILSPQLAAPNGNKTNQVNELLKTDEKKNNHIDTNIYFDMNGILTSLGI